jgi:hypothetical protein
MTYARHLTLTGPRGRAQQSRGGAVSMTRAAAALPPGVAWAFFNAKNGYAYPPNKQLANMTGLPINKVQEVCSRWKATVPSCAALSSATVQRAAFTPSPRCRTLAGVGATPLGWGSPPVGGGHNLKAPRMPKTELARARLRGGASQEREALRGVHGPGRPGAATSCHGHTPDRRWQLTVNNDEGLRAAKLSRSTPR